MLPTFSRSTISPPSSSFEPSKCPTFSCGTTSTVSTPWCSSTPFQEYNTHAKNNPFDKNNSLAKKQLIFNLLNPLPGMFLNYHVSGLDAKKRLTFLNLFNPLLKLLIIKTMKSHLNLLNVYGPDAQFYNPLPVLPKRLRLK